MTPKKATDSRRGPKFKFRIGALIYVFLFVYALIMTQLLENPISAVFFWFMVIAAPISFFVLLIGRAVIQVYVHSEYSRIEKYSPVDYELRIINQSPLIFPSVEAFVSEPSVDGIRSEKKRLVLTMVPFAGYIVKEKIAFKYRGFYEIGVSELYITDPLRLFRLRVDVDNYSNITVLPRRLPLTGVGMNSVSDIPSQFSRVLDVKDMSEVNNIREYRMGDALKSVHWKLSSKSEDLQVKEYNTNNDSHTYVLVDNTAPSPVPELERQEAKKKLNKLIRQKKKEDGEVGGILGFFKGIIDKIKKRSFQMQRAKGKSAEQIEDKKKLDEFINATSERGRKKAERKEFKAKVEEARKVDAETIARLQQIVGEGTEKTTKEKLEEAIERWGGAVKDSFKDEMPEYSVDGAVEIAVSAVTHEIREMHDCTAICFGEDGVVSYDITDSADFDSFYAKFATVPVASHEKNVSDLASIVNDSVNLTIKVVTSNIDPVSVSKYASIPAMFGGSGVGCSTEVLYFDSNDKYRSPVKRAEYVSNAAIELKQYGINLYDVKEIEEGQKIILESNLVI